MEWKCVFLCVPRCLLKPSLLEIRRPLIKVRNSLIACSRSSLLRLPASSHEHWVCRPCFCYRADITVNWVILDCEQSPIFLLSHSRLRASCFYFFARCAWLWGKKDECSRGRSTLNQNGVSNTVISLSQNEVGHNNCISKGNARLKPWSVSCHRICHVSYNKLPVFEKSGKRIQKRHKNKKEEKTKSSHSFEGVKYLEISIMN